MARKKKTPTFERFNEQIRSVIFSFLVALGIIIFLFLVFNIFAQNSSGTKPETNQKQVETQPETRLEKKPESKAIIRTHTVTTGESLSKIAEKYYGDKNDWTVLASENQIGNPNIIVVGTVLKVPDLDRQTSSISTNTQSKTEQTNTTANEPKIYTVVTGDTLWEISQQHYGGDGYQWFKIRDANPGKVGLLPSGRPLITPGTVLTIPNLN